MVNHCTLEKYKCFQWPVLIMCAAVNILTLLVNFAPSVMSQFVVNFFWTGAFVVTVVYYVAYVGSLLKVLSKALGIDI